MIIIKTQCPICGAVMAAQKIIDAAIPDEKVENLYHWSCPVCETDFDYPGDGERWHGFTWGIPDDAEPAQVDPIEVNEDEW